MTGSAASFAGPTLSRVSCRTAAYQGTGTDACSVYLTAKTSKRFSVYLSSNNPAVAVPSAVTVKSGALSTGFNATVGDVTTAQMATITAHAAGVVTTFSIALSPAVAGTPAIRLSTSSLAFGNVSVGTAISQSLTVTSSGTAPLTIGSDSVSGTGFSLLSGTTLPTTLSPGQAIVISVQFNPAIAGSEVGQLTISSNGGTASAALSGTGTVAAATVSALSCGSSSFTGSGTDTCTVSLSATAPSGGQSVLLASSNSAVTAPASIMVPAGASSASFAANVSCVSTTQAATLTATANSSSRSFGLQLNAATAALSVNARSIGFGNVFLNSPAEQPLTLTSTGTAPVTVNSVTISGAGFTESGSSFPATLNPGQSLTVNVQFDPTSAGTFSGQLAITSSATSYTLALTGTGEAHQVALSWLAPTGTTDPVVGYNVYRSASGTNLFQRVNASVDTVTAYTDASVQSGAIYDYLVKSVDASGIESAPSNKTTVTVP